MINPRFKEMLRELIAADLPVTSDYLARVNNVSPRTIRADMKLLNQQLSNHDAAIVSIRGKGYRLVIYDNERFRHYLQMMMDNDEEGSGTLPDTPEERIVFIIRKLLLAEGYIKIDDLADFMHVSKSTLQNDLKEVKRIFTNYGLTLAKRPNHGLKATGSEMKLRFCLAEYLFDRTKETAAMILTSQLSDLIEADKFQTIWKIILERIKQNGLTLSDIAINNLFIHLVIAYKRVKSGHHVMLYQDESREMKKQKEFQVACDMIQDIEGQLQVTFPDVEVIYITLHLLGTKMVASHQMKVEDLSPLIEDEYLRLTKQVLKEIENKLKLDISEDEELIMAIGLHLKPAINRFRYGMNIRNPLLQDIKKTYPMAFEAGVVAGLALEKLTNVTIDENEIGYLALHIGAAIERRNLKSDKPKRAIVVCASGAGSAQMIKYKLKSRFSDKIEVIKTTEYYKLAQCSLDAVDVIISSIPIQEELPVPIIYVNTILNDHDFSKIDHFITDRRTTVSEYLSNDLIFIHQPLNRKESVLAFLSSELKGRGLVGDDFLDGLYEREKVAPTAYGNLVAIPHPITPKWHETFVSICTLEKPVMWGDKPVQLVCLLNVKKESTEDLEALYGLLTKIVESPDLVQECLKCKKEKDVIEVLLKGIQAS
ncbi:lichenan operon transcriptional antiterminator [Evansella caseinilytica]|uniref:Lichenan operon transcriptional antiterminator n=1 Tax=Evansella caseinilytica TaxID=1503961 RepID=A0A1H3UTN1_9BACI|nr:BglG family transcription antiterminator [Evansella caseinilytica]SDZ65793.1 lichenan operon transcriptional antiterminator [Evansella caseinilytica]